MIPQQYSINTPYIIGPVHCYTAVLNGDLVLFDTGPPTAEGKKFLADNIDLSRLKHVVITHCHIDHCGLAPWLAETTGATVYLPYADHLKIIHWNKRLCILNDLLVQMGFAAEMRASIVNRLSSGLRLSNLPTDYKIVEENFCFEEVEVISCPGHSQSDLVYAGENWAITGDTLLKGVFQSPLFDADFITGKRFQNYQSYCTSIVKLSRLKGKQILPGHRIDVDGVDDTLLFYLSKMFQRLEGVKRLGRTMDIAATIESMYGQFLTDPFHIYLKASEIVFMWDFLDHPALLIHAIQECSLYERLARKIERALVDNEPDCAC